MSHNIVNWLVMCGFGTSAVVRLMDAADNDVRLSLLVVRLSGKPRVGDVITQDRNRVRVELCEEGYPGTFGIVASPVVDGADIAL